MDVDFTPGKALIITGPQGCGKTLLAIEVAKRHGSFIEVDAHELDLKHGVDGASESGHKTIICDGFPSRMETLQRIKQMLTQPTVTINRKYQEPKAIKPPKFIFCTGSHEPIPNDQRFAVVKLDRRADKAT